MKLLLSFLLLTFSLITVAQNKSPKYPFIAEQMPRYYDEECETLPTVEEKRKCAEKKMLEIVYKNVKNPPDSCSLYGTVVIRFDVNEEGKATNHQIFRDIGCFAGEESLKVTKLLKRWIPAEKNGKKIAITHYLQFRFRPPY